MHTFSINAFQGIIPQIDADAFVAPTAVVLGDVRVGKYASIWPGAVARGDMDYISIGEYSNLQDLACLHVADHAPCIIGDYVTIGHGACVHACTVEDHVLIGINATVLTGAHIGRGSIIAAGAVVLEDAVIPPNSLVVGVPGKVKATINRIDNIHNQAVMYKTEWAIRYGICPNIGGELYHGEPTVTKEHS